VRQFLVDRYGEFVLLKPVLAPHTLVLWLAAPTLLILGGIVIFVAVRRRRGAPELAMAPTVDEQAVLQSLEENGGGAESGLNPQAHERLTKH